MYQVTFERKGEQVERMWLFNDYGDAKAFLSECEAAGWGCALERVR